MTIPHEARRLALHSSSDLSLRTMDETPGIIDFQPLKPLASAFFCMEKGQVNSNF